MPIYEYRRPDGTTFEVMQRMTDDPLTKDPETGVPLERVFHPVAVHFKGKGFYNTDYGTKRRNRELRESAESGADKYEAGQADKKKEKEKAAASSSSSDSSSAAAKPKAEKKSSSGSGSGDKKSSKKSA
ncbi:FmdB family zinc ribbon protein [Baekduia sp.]|jgi:putative FmdB family regulatory protein|uniref:FmdB family zinc ribbon protein n=1 Tax=Baekduia sp. TaxID=2600305 RepID=UPI002E010F20|nr:FmdB family zinc ribbon protein [Baekduia sp.]